ncbi:MAG: acetate--CoA ligase [Verrucomicrobia bacterium]|nr:acetate--CoA ligase [Verrucomicrobiota bacterium]MBU4291438.1 acetate--CoA ligase [Verrucomicrobiota bacterium]MBU4430450.1 acetate--CoA ligase [Verrucomicrobiota bacterium]MCG2679566.1 acetate--CoA ligase [Kiritimatiellia bacterium]
MLMDSTSNIECSLHETRVFPVPPAFASSALVNSPDAYQALYRASMDNPDAFWSEQAQQHLVWAKPWNAVCEWNLPNAKWFSGGQLNASVNCLDKHLNTPVANKAALIWEGEPYSPGRPGEERVLTYRQLHREVCRFANVLKRNGVGKGDRAIIYMPMIPEAVVAMLACARIGAIHSVVFGGFSAQAVAERIKDCEAKIVITADSGYRRGAIVQLKQSVDEALALKDVQGCALGASVKKVIVARRAGNDITMESGRDVWWHSELDHVDANCPPESMDSEDVLFILYTSGSTGKPKGIFHSTAGYLLGVKMSHQNIFDVRDTDIFWCTADIGWITGHSYVVYGPLANGATVFLYEGAPNFPDKDRYWKMIAKYGITIFYTAPTAIRAFMQWGDEWPKKHDLSSLRLLGTVGEPINPQAWIWYHEHIGGKLCPIVDTWWQTETGSIMISTFPGAVSAKPGSAGLPLPGVHPEILDDQGKPVPCNAGGKLVIRRPWPSMLRGVWGDPERFTWTYWKDVPGSYLTGDGARQDADGYFWIVGRIDDVLNVSGHRIGTAEVESALVSHPAVAEAAVVGRPDDIKGFALVVFVTLRSGMQSSPALRDELRKHVGNELGAVAKPDEIRFTQSLPKTRSGKIMRRLLKQVASGTEVTGDMTTLEDFNVLARLSGEEE